MALIEELERFNPWWKTGQVKDSWLKSYKRKLFFDVGKYIDKRQILLIYGLRRLGKTTLMFQLIDQLLGKGNQKNILYFSFDDISFDLKDVLETYQKVFLNKTFEETNGKVYLFLDEIQKVKDWENKIKIYYDLYPDIKFIVSGSASVRLRKGSKESLAGRIFDFVLNPLSFAEFLELRGMNLNKIKEEPDLWKRELLPLFYRFIKFGAFPELAKEEDEEIAVRYILNNVIERIVYKDLPEEFEIKDIELLKNLVYLIGKNPGMLVNYKEIAKNFGRDQRTIANFFGYLEFGLLAKFVFNYRGSHLASMRKLKKVYLASPNIAFVFSQNLEKAIPSMLENLVLAETDARFFYRNSFEVDFVIVDGDKLVPMGIKKEGKDLKQLKRFIEKFKEKIKNPLIIDLEKEEKVDEIRIISAWRWLLERSG